MIENVIDGDSLQRISLQHFAYEMLWLITDSIGEFYITFLDFSLDFLEILSFEWCTAVKQFVDEHT